MYILENELESFKFHLLEDLKESSLMDRVDSKFLIEKSDILNVIKKIKTFCTVLKINGRTISGYKTVYYDTSNYDFYYKHHNGKLNRHKVRYRNYLDEDTAYLEIKLKNNKGRTIKERIRIDSSEDNAIKENIDFLTSYGIPNPEHLRESQKCFYSRIAFANEKNGERLTMDFGLHFKFKEETYSDYMSNWVVVELKQKKTNKNSQLYSIIRECKVRPTSFSKYCIGINLIHKEKIKSNRFKKTILQIKKNSEKKTDELNC